MTSKIPNTSVCHFGVLWAQVSSVWWVWSLCVTFCCLMSVMAETPARPRPLSAGGGPERLDFDLGQNGDYRFDYATGEVNSTDI
jgi:hypothetical protein